jgi:hypothetical protein
MSDTVAIVFDREFGVALRGISDADAWVIDSPANSAVVDELRRAGNRRLTSFVDHLEPDIEAFDEILRTIELHHGEFAQDPPFGRAVVYGLEFDPDFQASLDAVGFEFEAHTTDGFIIHRVGQPFT